MKLIILFIAATQGPWVTTIDGEIYITPVPEDCKGCSVEFVQVHEEDRWVELRTDRISITGFEGDL